MEDLEIYLLINKYKDSVCNLRTVTAAIHEFDLLQHPPGVIMHARKESGNFKSHVFKHNNNMFGMRKARVRKHCQAGTYIGYAYYDTWIESIVDYYYWQKMRKVCSKNYFVYLNKRRYFCSN